MSVYSDNADRFATRDRGEHVDANLNAACADAIEILRVGITHDDKWAAAEAERVLAKAQLSADRVLGRAAS